ncbi:hypothetical protein B0J13DRAFT_234204 [Dactylonectria estremocensis]|uniref:Uncharacterized protein n=1 Tax=Dactylonectria estremocensis TaxID=1079267 RepID=A0A9P9F8K3_9HYPO|nr:hypothetical protein B0J13DRAFT_234204 [Dactylonectria estremocensis]
MALPGQAADRGLGCLRQLRCRNGSRCVLLIHLLSARPSFLASASFLSSCSRLEICTCRLRQNPPLYSSLFRAKSQTVWIILLSIFSSPYAVLPACLFFLGTKIVQNQVFCLRLFARRPGQLHPRYVSIQHLIDGPLMAINRCPTDLAVSTISGAVPPDAGA